MIYVDDLQDYPSGKWCHCWTDGEDRELDLFAISIGLKKSWAQTSHGLSGRFYHYDLRPTKRTLALQKGATYMALRDWIAPEMKKIYPG